MRKAGFLLSLSLLMAALSMALPALFPFVLGKQKVPVSTNARPSKGARTVDTRFHIPVSRLTEISTDHYAGPGITNEYSRFDPSNTGGTRVILYEFSTGSWILFQNTPPFRKIRRLPSSLSGDIEPRWDPSNPNVLYAFRRTQLVSYDISSNKVSVVYDFRRDFPGAQFAGTNAEGEPSENCRWWTVLIKQASGRPLAVVSFDKNARAIVSRKTTFEYNLDSVEINWVSTTPISGEPVIGWCYRPERDPFGSQHRGAIRYDRSWHKIADTMADGHCDLAVGKNNQECLIYQNNANDFVEMANLATGARTRLFRIPFAFDKGTEMGLHFSGNIRSTSPKKGWALVAVDESDRSNNSWASNQIFLVELKSKPRIWRLAFNHNNYSGEYFTECFAALSRDGRKVYFQSNWGESDPLSTEEYFLTLPPGWETTIDTSTK
jgi:hypothetical protein